MQIDTFRIRATRLFDRKWVDVRPYASPKSLYLEKNINAVKEEMEEKEGISN